MTTQYSPAWNNASRTQTCIRANVSDSGSAANSTLLDLQVNNVSKFTVDKFGELIIAPTARTAGSDALINLIAPADTTRAAGVEATDINFNLARTVQFAAGNITDQRAVRIQAPTYSFASASTITNASTLSISGPPVAGTNATITNAYALNVESGTVRFGRGIIVGDSSIVSLRPSFGIDIVTVDSRRRLLIASNAGIAFSTANDAAWDRPADVMIQRDSARALAFYSATVPGSTANAITLRSYNVLTDASNYERLALQFGTFSSARHAQIAAESAGTGAANINLVLTPRGTGALIAGPPPDGTAAGGNARGANAADLCTSRSSASAVASGSKAYVGPAGGTASGQNSSAFGPNSTSSGTGAGSGGEASVVSGQSSFGWGQGVTIAGYGAAGFGESTETVTASAFVTGKASRAHSSSTRAHASAHFANRGTGNIVGSAQMIEWTMAASAAPGVVTELFTTAAGSTSLSVRVLCPDNTMQSGAISIQAVNSSGTAEAFFVRQYAIKRVAGTVSEVFSPVTIGADHNPSSAAIGITADNTNKHIKITFQPPASTTNITGDAATDVIISAGHGFADGQEIAFSGLVGGAGLSSGTLYFVRDATANTFKVTTGFPTNTATNFTTNITSGTVGYIWNVNAVCRMEEVRRGA